MNRFPRIVEKLMARYGAAAAPPARNVFEHVVWENACYLLPDERRLQVFEGLRRQVGLTPDSIAGADDSVLLPLARRGGLRPETRVFRWRQIAAVTLNQFGGDLDSILKMPYTQAKRALKQFPTVGDPGAEKILLFCGMAMGLPLESNGLRVLSQLGWGRIQRDYGATYRSVQDSLSPELPRDAKSLKQAHLLLRIHGRELCKTDAPLCRQCPVATDCSYAAKTAASFQLPYS